MIDANAKSLAILGVDPGYAILGWGVVEYRASRHRLMGYGTVETSKDLSMPERLKELYRGLTGVIAKYEPDVAAVEELFFNSNQKTAIKVGEARGAAVLACANAGLDVYEYTPLQIKQALTGYGRAEKKQIQEMVRQVLGLVKPPTPDDAADAVACAICHANASAHIERVGRFAGKGI
ncbi:MAG: crossover junction endodeoxyribonuclease RuvC [Clostridiales Family XIII bacterium]|jgi:crossover junction endodeoxyribonuclease RuvC|nr:crossover junction endodeoxyribonuclease RuvC [Clostridiales Family XIII bacterium]